MNIFLPQGSLWTIYPVLLEAMVFYFFILYIWNPKAFFNAFGPDEWKEAFALK